MPQQRQHPPQQRHRQHRVRFRLPHPPKPPAQQTPRDFEDLAGPLLHQVSRRTGSTFSRRFLAAFGAPPHVVSAAWNMIVANGSLDELGPRSRKPVHLLWALMWMKGYATETENASRAKCCETTFRKWSWFYIERLANLDQELVCVVLPCQHSNDVLTNTSSLTLISHIHLLHLPSSYCRFAGRTDS